MSKFYVYQSCFPLNIFSVKNTQVVQTTKLVDFDLKGVIFKSDDGFCWSFLGEFENNYISNSDVFQINYSGNYFSNVVNIKYPDCNTCNSTVVSPCEEIYFSGIKCDSEDIFDVKICNVGPTVGNLKLLPNIGDVCGVKNPSGDDFCITITGISSSSFTNYEIITPAWEFYNCDTCPIYKTYTANSCDLTVTGLTVYDLSANTTLSSGNTVSINSDEVCYQIISYDGIVVEYNAVESGVPFIKTTYDSCDNCLNSYYSI